MAARDSAPQAVDPDPVTDALVVIGGGEHGAVVVDAARSTPDRWQVAGVVDPDPGTAAAEDPPVLGTDDEFLASMTTMPEAERPTIVLGLGGSNAARRRLAATYGRACTWATVVHAAAVVAPSATLGPGVVVLAGAIVGPRARIGAHGIVNSGAIVEHDTTVGDHVHVAPGVVIGGGARIDDGAFVGLGATVRDHVTIGAEAVVAMGAVVVGDVAPGTTVAGVPARPLER
jgi:sugar O-acyltransferase (sialic acid O-acetyltransferase NeuD family)